MGRAEARTGPSPADLAAHLEQVGLEAGLDVVGVTTAEPFEATRRTLEQRKREGLHGGMQFTYRNPQRSTDPGQALPGARSLIVGARSYRRRTKDAANAHGAEAHRGAVARYSWIDHYADLRAALEAMADELRRAGWGARVLADDNALVDREAARRAGLGFYGKNTNLLLHGARGSEFVLGSVVTDASLPATVPAEDAGCGPCERCLPACPTGALIEPGVLDARRCLAWLLQAEGDFPPEHRQALGGRIYGCDACQDVCPPNRLEIRRRTPPIAEPGAEAEVDLVALLETEDDDELLRRFGRWYIARRDARYLRRNALIALGNVGDPGDDATRRAIRSHLDRHDDPMLQEHAAWAASQLDVAELRLGAVPTPR
ncbi:MAG TPA: tRNA epoxyqueuosine(34) reductase QueG [Acidimicrobiales bacterium]|nr:tRNA epoxyqueuosine(34) reductase QueG [Acidimicrobiales bacterium]